MFSFLFLIQGIAPNLDIGCEVQKLPNLFEHYEEHKRCNGGSFWQFLIDDYLNVDGGSREHRDDSNHNNLPFNGNHKCCHPSAFYASDENFQLVVFEFASQNKFGYYAPSFSSEYLDTPFHPPKA